jgi:hypothetical protein
VPGLFGVLAISVRPRSAGPRARLRPQLLDTVIAELLRGGAGTVAVAGDAAACPRRGSPGAVGRVALGPGGKLGGPGDSVPLDAPGHQPTRGMLPRAPRRAVRGHRSFTRPLRPTPQRRFRHRLSTPADRLLRAAAASLSPTQDAEARDRRSRRLTCRRWGDVQRRALALRLKQDAVTNIG